MSTPLLILSDMPTGPTGLGRITRELATKIALKMSWDFDVSVCGPGGTHSRYTPFDTYPVNVAPDTTIPQLPEVWNDFAGDQKGIIFCIWNASWLDWFADPSMLPPGGLRAFLESGKFKRWIYVPVDATGPKYKLPESQGKILNGFDRALAYTKFGSDVIYRAIGERIENLPHGLDTNIFRPISRKECRERLLPEVMLHPGKISEDIFLLGAVATNTPRKDWGLCFEACGELLRRGENIGLWAHTDHLRKGNSWDLMMLAEEFGMGQRTFFTKGHLSDEQMAIAYNACDVTLGIGSGEGFGYPIFESVACGVPCIHGDYAGAAEFLPAEYKVAPTTFRLDGFYGLRRPVFRPDDWATAIMLNRGKKAYLDKRLDWKVAWPKWQRWLEEGVK